MSILGSLLVLIIRMFPWVAISLTAAYALRKRRDSNALTLEVLGAVSSAGLILAQQIVDGLLRGLGANSAVPATDGVFEFLLFISVTAFAVGFCMEKFQKRGRAIDIPGLPADD